MTNMDAYVVGALIGEGQFGTVKRGTVKATGAPVALKMIRINRLSEGIPHPVAREALLATRLTHQNIIRTFHVFPSGSYLVFAMEHCERDLASQLAERAVYNPLPRGQARHYMKMLLSALQYLHADGILHRDVKPSNCLISTGGGTGAAVLKLADFGLSRMKSTHADMSHEVASRWYRAPELLFGCRQYEGEIDMWSAGCVFAELLRGYGAPLFTGDGDINQLSRIFSVLGTPSEEVWPGVSQLPDYAKVHFDADRGSGLAGWIPAATPSALDLLMRLLSLDPARRPTPGEALNHPYFLEL